MAGSGQTHFEAVSLTGERVNFNISVIRDPGHAEPWIIAILAKPGSLTTLDHAKRWGIAPMFSDLKSRGFGIDQTQIHKVSWFTRALRKLIKLLLKALPVPKL